MKLCLLMNSVTIICMWILVIPIGIIEVSTPRKLSFLLYFSSIHHYVPPSTWNSLVHTSLGEMEQCEIVLFSSSKWEKDNQLNHKNHVRNRRLLRVTSSSMKDYPCNYGVRTWKSNVYINFNKNNEKLRIWKFFVYT